MKTNDFKSLNFLNLIGYFLVGFVCFPYIIYNIFFFLNIELSRLNSWIVFIVYCVSFFFFLKINVKIKLIQNCKSILFGLICIIISCFISSYFLDYSFDGQGYHGEAILQFANKFNPIYSKLPDKENFTFFVINHFAKASWVSNAYLFLLTNNFNCAKANNLILIIANFCFIYPFINQYFNKIKSIIISLLLAFNPIALNIYLSNMLDSQITSLLFIFFVLLYYFYVDYKNYILYFIILIVIYLINLKFPIIIYLSVFLLLFIIFIMHEKKIKFFFIKILIISFSFIVALFIFGYHTYTKNIIEYKHPFYPFYGDSSNASGKLPNNFPTGMVEAKEFKVGNRFVNHIKSNFASTIFNQAYTNKLKYKIPFTFSKYELERFAFSGVMIGGYGVWYSGVISITFILLVYFIFKRKKQIFKNDFIFYLFITSIYITILLNPYGYIARYSPQYYLIPFIVLLMYKIYFPKFKFIQWILLFVLIINSILICGYTYYNLIVTAKVKEQIKIIKSSQKTIGVNFYAHSSKRQLFIDNNIKYHDLHLKVNEKPDTLFRSEVVFKIDN